MYYQTAFLSKLLLIIALFLSPVSLSAERADLYSSGKEAFDSKNYVIALMNLNAFFILNENNLNEHPDLMRTLQEKITYCKTILTLVLATNNNLTLGDNNVIIKSSEIINDFTGTGMQVQDLFEDKSINIQEMMNVRTESIQ